MTTKNTEFLIHAIAHKTLFNDCLFELEERHMRRENKKWEESQETQSTCKIQSAYMSRTALSAQSLDQECCCHTNMWCDFCLGKYEDFNEDYN